MSIVQRFGEEGQMCFLFPAKEAAEDCKAFAISKDRKEKAFSPDDISIRIFDIDRRVYAVFFPAQKAPDIMDFWSHPGTGISTRWAEESLKHIDLIREVSDDDPAPKQEDDPSYQQIRARIAEFLERNPVGPPRAKKISPSDVYLFNTGMSAMYYFHKHLLTARPGKTVQIAFPFHSTYDNLEFFAPEHRLVGRGTPEELSDLESFVADEYAAGRQISSIWTEFPSNPLLITPDLPRLRALATKYSIPFIVDRTIASFCNVDVLASNAADVVWTSITKSFSGRSDVMGGSLAVNPNSPLYPFLRSVLEVNYHNDMHPLDAKVLEKNSADYFPRSIALNRNAAAIAAYFHEQSLDPESPVRAIHYPPYTPSKANYDRYMRPSTLEFPDLGYGCLMSVEFESIETTRAFYDNLHFHHGPHLGAQLTLALAYNKGILGKDLERFEGYGFNDRMIRISAGWMEEAEELVKVCRHAVGKAVKEKKLVKEMAAKLEMPATVA